MFKRRLLWAIVVACCLLVVATATTWWWCQDALSIPTEPEQLVLYSIDGRKPPETRKPESPDWLYGFPVLGKVEITSPTERREIMRALRWSVAEHTPGSMNACFWPRHAIRVVVGGRTADYVICFECRQLELRHGESRQLIGMTRSPRSLFNRVLRDAGIPIVPSPVDGSE